MMYTFPAVFTVNADRSFTVQFVDVPGAITEGRDIETAVDNAAEVLSMILCTHEDNHISIPMPTAFENIDTLRNQFVKFITVDTAQYRQLLKEIGDNPIRYARQQAGLNIKELADFLGAPYRTVQDWNSGKNRPPRWCEQLIFDRIMSLTK